MKEYKVIRENLQMSGDIEKQLTELASQGWHVVKLTAAEHETNAYVFIILVREN